MPKDSLKNISILVDKYLKGTITESEKNILQDWYMKIDSGEISWNNPADTKQMLRVEIYEAIRQKIIGQDQKFR